MHLENRESAVALAQAHRGRATLGVAFNLVLDV